MRRSWLWQRIDEPGLEHFVVEEPPDAIVLEGSLVASLEGQPLRLRYTVRCTAGFELRGVDLSCEAVASRRLVLQRDEDGRWTDGNGVELPQLRGCDDVDIAATPSTNTLPLRRLGLSRGESAEVRVAYVSVPDLAVSVDRQRYTLLRQSNSESVYRFESLDAAPGFVAELTVDADGFVMEYEGLFRRL